MPQAEGAAGGEETWHIYGREAGHLHGTHLAGDGHCGGKRAGWLGGSQTHTKLRRPWEDWGFILRAMGSGQGF